LKTENQSSKNTGNIKKNYIYKNFPDKFLTLGLKDITATAERKKVLITLKEILTSIESNKSPKGIYLHGKEGVGKSYISIIALNYLASKGKKVAHIFIPEFISYLKDAMASKKSTYKIIEELKMVDVLLIDDLGSETVTG
jgi:primosomal protein DnaI